MKIYKSNEIKNLCLLGNSGSGKTTLAEAMMYEGGVINRRGTVENKNTVSDYYPVEHELGNTVFSTVLYTEWQNKKLNIIDTPGLDDFVGATVSALKVADTCLMTINAQNGVEVGTEIAARNTEKTNKPLLFVVNQLDHDKANFELTLEQLKQSFGNKAVPVQYPIAVGTEFNSVVDVLLMKMYKWGPEGGEPEIVDIPDSELDKANELHNALVESAAENDEELMELYFDKGSLTEDEMRKGIKAGMINRDLFPLFCVSAKKDMGIRRLMEFINNVTPTVNEMPLPVNSEGTEIKPDENAEASIFVFKTSIEPHLGEVSFFKVMSGTVKIGMDLRNTNKNQKERLSQIYAVAGNNRTKLDEIVAGDIGATVKLKYTKCNHTLNEKSDFEYSPLEFPNSRYRTAIKAVTEADEEKLSEALTKIHEEDQSLIVEYSKELKQTILSGQGEHHLNIVKWRLNNIYKLEIEYIKPKIPYRETITKQAQASYRHKKQSGGSGQFGEVHMFIEPFDENAPEPTTFKHDGKESKISVRDTEVHDLSWGGKLRFYNCIVGGSIDNRFMPAIIKGIMEKMEEGPLTGSYARDISVAVYDGKMHPVDSNEISFKLAGRNAFRAAFKTAGPKILEPIYAIEVLVPSDSMGDVMSDLQGRRAMIEGMESEKGFEKLKAKVPLAEMDKYSTTLSSLTNGRATFSMSFSNYEKVPGDVQEVLLKAYEEVEEE